MNDATPDPQPTPPPMLVPLVPLAPALMMVFWILLGSSAGIKLLQSLWQLLGWTEGEVSIAVPVGGATGAAVGVLLGRIKSPKLLVLLMAVFAGSAAGGVAGRLAWGSIGEIVGQVVAGSVGGLAWATWLYVGRERSLSACARDNSPACKRDSSPSCDSLRQGAGCRRPFTQKHVSVAETRSGRIHLRD